MMRMVVVTVGVWLLCFLLFASMRTFPAAMRFCFTPKTKEPRGAAAFPGFFGWIDELSDDAAAVRDGESGVESQMLLRFMRHNLRLLGYGVVTAIILIPVYVVEPHYQDPALEAASGSNSTGSLLHALTLQHVPLYSRRNTATGIVALLFAIVYVVEQTCAALRTSPTDSHTPIHTVI